MERNCSFPQVARLPARNSVTSHWQAYCQGISTSFWLDEDNRKLFERNYKICTKNCRHNDNLISYEKIAKKKRNFTCHRRSVEMSVNFQPRLRSSCSSWTFRPTLKYPSILHFSSPNPEPRSPAVTWHFVGRVSFANRLAVFVPRDVHLYFLTAQPAFEDNRLVLEHGDVMIQTHFELGNWKLTAMLLLGCKSSHWAESYRVNPFVWYLQIYLARWF